MPNAVRKKQQKDYSRVFEKFGYTFNRNGSAEAVADACPWCGGSKFYLNLETGLFDCKSGKCRQTGTISTFLTWLHGQYLAETTDAQYRALKEKRGGIALQVLKRHGLAWAADLGRWLTPFRNPAGDVVNLQLYDPATTRKPNKWNLPCLCSSIYGLDQLGSDKKKILFLCEGPFDAMALDWHLKQKRAKYDILATPGPFKESWAEFFRGRKVRALFDNDQGGQQHAEQVRRLLGESRVAKELRILKWPSEFPEGCDINDLVRDHPDIALVGWTLENSVRAMAAPRLVLCTYRQRQAARPIDWIWQNHIRCGTYVRFSGHHGTMKSTIAGEIVAAYTTGKPMPMEKTISMPAGTVLYLHAEDDEDAVWDRLEFAGADCNRVTLMAASVKDGDPLNMLDNLEEIEEVVREKAVRFVVIDGQNSVVGAPDISTDQKGRYNVTNRLHQFAQRLNICLLGIVNEDREGRAMGSQSMGDIARCVLRTELTKELGNERFYRLVFVKVSDAAPKTHRAIPYGVQDCGGRHRRIRWNREAGKVLKEALGRRKK